MEDERASSSLANCSPEFIGAAGGLDLGWPWLMELEPFEGEGFLSVRKENVSALNGLGEVF